jgi:hypothetical protein
MPPPYPLRVLLEDLVKRVVGLSLGPAALTEHKPIIVGNSVRG